MEKSRILIVDDNENNLYTLNALIGKYMDVDVLQALEDEWLAQGGGIATITE